MPLARSCVLLFCGLLLVPLASCQDTARLNAVEADAALARGDSALNRLAYGEAARLYGEAAALDPDFAEAYSRQGLALWAARQFEAAIPVLDRAIELNPDDARAYYYRGSSYLSLSRFEESIPDLRTATDLGTLDPEDGRRAHHLRAISYMNLEQYGEAIAAMTEAIAIVPDQPFYYIERARLYQFTEQEEAAVEDYTAFLRLSENESELTAEARQRLDELGADVPPDSTAGN